MEKIMRFFSVGLGCMLIWSLLTYAENYSHMSANFDSSESGFQILKNYDYSVVEKEGYNNPVEQYVFSPTKVGAEYRTLVFFTVHQNAEVFIGNDRYYVERQNLSSALTKDPGYYWHYLVLPKTALEQKVTIQIDTPYESVVGRPIKIYYGNRSDIRTHIIFEGIKKELLFSAFCIFLAVLFIALGTIASQNDAISNEVLYLGGMAFLIGCWKIFDSEATAMIFNSASWLPLMPFFALILVPIPSLLFVRSLFIKKDHIIWNITFICCALIDLVVTILQLYRVFDIYELRNFINASIIIAVLGVLVMIPIEIYKEGFHAKLRKNFTLLAIFFVGIGIDMFSYYFFPSSNFRSSGIICLSIYLTLVGAEELKDLAEAMEKRKEVNAIQQIAYHDQLTKVYNRTAYSEDINADDFSPERCYVAVFDLNNLKKVNDNLGHEVGDFYISEGARIISESFSDLGKCYRMGGDEFCALVRTGSYDKMKAAMESVKEKVAIANLKQDLVNISIAGGFEHYDVRIDHTINDTYKRADKKMYQEKNSMKQAIALEQAEEASEEPQETTDGN